MQQLKTGNPLDEDTYLGPLISEADAIRIEKWVHESGFFPESKTNVFLKVGKFQLVEKEMVHFLVNLDKFI